MARSRIKVGDIFRIPLPEGRFGYCQYIQWNDQMGCLTKVFDLVAKNELRSIDELSEVPEMFPPIFVGLKASAKSGRWAIVGNLPVAPIEFPTFRASNGYAAGVYGDWSLWDGASHRFIGVLPTSFRKFEKLVIWGDELVEERIASGIDIHAEII